METEILFNPFAKQITFIEAVFSNKYTFILYGGGIRSGKTFSSLGILILLSKIYPQSRWVVVRKDLQTIKRNTLPSWEKIKPTNFFTHMNRDTMTATAINGSQIIFFGENYERDKDFDRWKGLEVNGFLLEEINEMQRGGYLKAIERAGSYIIKNGKQPKPIIMATCNPTQGWVKNEFYDKWEAGILPKNQLYIPAKITDNTFIPKEYIENLKTLPRYEYQVYVEGNWNVRLKTGGEFLKEFEVEKHIGNVIADKDATYHISIDSNVLPYIAISIWQVLKRDGGWDAKKIDELPAEYPHNSANKAGKYLVKYLKGKDYKQKIYLYGDATTKAKNNIDDENRSFLTLFMQPIKDAGYTIEQRFFNKNPIVSTTGEFINAIFEMNLYGINITIGENCKKTISDYIEVKEDKDGGMAKKRVTDPETKVSFEPYGHLLDTDRYFLCKVFEPEYKKFMRRLTDYADKSIPDVTESFLSGGF